MSETTPDAMATPPRPHVLMVYYTHTQQAQRVSEAMSEVLRARGCDVTQASIEFTDPKYSKNFKTFPFKHAVFSLSLIHISEPTRRTPISYAVFCLKKK